MNPVGISLSRGIFRGICRKRRLNGPAEPLGRLSVVWGLGLARALRAG